ncbi:hypothetical protein MC885_018542, partial [Smutsia gigantea]
LTVPPGTLPRSPKTRLFKQLPSGRGRGASVTAPLSLSPAPDSPPPPLPSPPVPHLVPRRVVRRGALRQCLRTAQLAELPSVSPGVQAPLWVEAAGRSSLLRPQSCWPLEAQAE